MYFEFVAYCHELIRSNVTAVFNSDASAPVTSLKNIRVEPFMEMKCAATSKINK